MAKVMDDTATLYIRMLVFVFLAFGSFLVALITAFFGGVGLYFGQGIVENDVFTDPYKYECANDNESQADCTNFTTNKLPSYVAYEDFRTDINDTVPRYLTATVVIFSLLGLVFLFLALRSAGLWKKSKEKSDAMDYN